MANRTHDPCADRPPRMRCIADGSLTPPARRRSLDPPSDAAVQYRRPRMIADAGDALLRCQRRLAAQVPTPDAHFGFRMGADRPARAADAIEQYFELVAARSDRVRIVDIGPTTEGHRTIAAIISAPENIRNLDADPRDQPAARRSAHAVAGRGAATRRDAQGRSLAIGCSIHASEIGATQAANELLLHARDRRPTPATLDVLRQRRRHPDPVAQSGRPSAGRRLVQQDTRARRSKAAPMPWLVPQVRRPRHQSRRVHDEPGGEPQPRAVLLHRVASAGVPDDAPDGEQRPALLRAAEHRSDRSQLRSAHLARRRRCSAARWRSSCSATAARASCRTRMYDYYWPGYEDSAPLGHNTVCLLTEVASVKRRDADHGRADDLRAGRRGCAEYRAADQLSRSLARRPLDAARHRRLRPERGARPAARGVAPIASRSCRTSTTWDGAPSRPGDAGGPFAFVIPPEQHDPLRGREARRAAAAGRHRDPARARAVPRRRRAVSRPAPTSSSWRSRTAPT